MQTNWLVSIWHKFLQKSFSKQAIKIWISIPVIPRNIFKLHAKKIHIKNDKNCVCEKIHSNIILAKRNLGLKDLRFFCYSKDIIWDIKRPWLFKKGIP